MTAVHTGTASLYTALTPERGMGTWFTITAVFHFPYILSIFKSNTLPFS